MSTAATFVVIFGVGALGVYAASLLLPPGLLSLGAEQTSEGRDIASLYDPVHAGEELPFDFRQVIRRDGIRPVYEPEFLSAAETEWHDDTLVVALVINGDAKAYPVSFLNRREIVNDHVGKTPVLVTW